MTAQEILDEIRMLGGRLEARGDQLHLEAPKNVITSELRQALATLKPELLELLRSQSELQERLANLGIRIAIDNETSAVCLVFTDSEAKAVATCAKVYSSFELHFTESQKRDLLADLKYYEELLKRKEAQL